MSNYGSPVLVTGATGNTGAPIVGTLSAAGVPVRAMFRSQSRAESLPDGVEPVIADFDNAASITNALDGVNAAYLVTPSSERAESQQLRFVELAAQAGVQRIVLLSQLGARRDSPVRFLRYHAVVEEKTRELKLGYTFLRPNLYFQGLFAFAETITHSNSFAAPIGEVAISAIDVRDIADVAVAALTNPAHEGATYTLTGPAAITHSQMAADLSDATGRTIRFKDSTPPEFAAALQGILPPWQIDGLLEDYAHYRRGEAAEVTTAVADVTGHPPRQFAHFARDHTDTFID